MEVFRLTDVEGKHMAAPFTKNYSLENLPDRPGECSEDSQGTMLRLVAGRLYLVGDESSISERQVLSRMNDIDCVFLAPVGESRLCDRNVAKKSIRLLLVTARPVRLIVPILPTNSATGKRD
jgi:hypothetical protein